MDESMRRKLPGKRQNTVGERELPESTVDHPRARFSQYTRNKRKSGPTIPKPFEADPTALKPEEFLERLKDLYSALRVRPSDTLERMAEITPCSDSRNDSTVGQTGRTF
ncbi:hypothetical protein KM043_013246 [Ampulex compressa]|nr:hypothetical protein KM043_013246 [Ampulex compressa]